MSGHVYHVLDSQASGQLLPLQLDELISRKLGESAWQAKLARHAAAPLGYCYLLLAVASVVLFGIAADKTNLLPTLAAVRDALFEDAKHSSGRMWSRAHLLWYITLAAFATVPFSLLWSAAVMLHNQYQAKLQGIRLDYYIRDHKQFQTALHGHWFVIDAWLPWLFVLIAYTCMFTVSLPSLSKLPTWFSIGGAVATAVLVGSGMALLVRKRMRGEPPYQQVRDAAWQRVLAVRTEVGTEYNDVDTGNEDNSGAAGL